MPFDNRAQALTTIAALEEALDSKVADIAAGFGDISALANGLVTTVPVSASAKVQLFYQNAKLDKTVLTLAQLDDLFVKINSTLTALDGVTRVIDTYRTPENGGEHIADLLAALAAGQVGSIAGVAAMGFAATAVVGAPVLATFALGAVVGLGVTFIANAAFQDVADRLWLDRIAQLTGEGLGWAVYETAQAVSWLATTPERTYQFLNNLTGADVIGTDGNDTIDVYGDRYTYAIVGKTVFGLDGNDYIEGGTTKDSILGGAGDDTIKSAALEVFGGLGDDYIEASNAQATVYGGAGDDTMSGAADMVGGAGDDTFLWTDPDATLDAYVSYQGDGRYFLSSRLTSLTLSEVENIRLSDGTNLKLITESLPAQLVDVGREDTVQLDPSQALLSDGRVVMVWTDAWRGDGDTSGNQIRATIFNADMTEKSVEFRVNSTTQNFQQNAEVTALDDGGFVVVWTNVNSVLSNNYRTTTRYQMFDANGDKVGAERSVSGDMDYRQYNPHVASLDTGGFAVIWVDSDTSDRSGDTSGDAVMGRLFDANGAPDGAAFFVNSTYAGSQFEPRIAQLKGGGFAVSWQFESGYNAFQIASQAFDASGQKIGSENVIAREISGFITPPTVNALADGSYIVSWHDADLGYVGQKYIADGQATGALITFDHGVNAYNTNILGLADGRMLFSQNDAMVVYAADGTQQTPYILNMVSPDSYALAEHMLQMADGRVIATQDSDTDDWNDVYITRSIVTQVLDIPDAVAFSGQGTDGNDTLIGGAGANRLEGGAGNDRLDGRDGADTLIGGAGDDILFGGASAADLRDVIYGGDGNDSIDGGYGNDELRGDAGNDTVAGGFGADTVIGGAGDDVLTGSAYGDVIFGSDGNDFINGGFGFDRVNGGTGADKFFHLGIRDHGADWIQDYTAADGDVLQFGGAANTAPQDFLIQRASTPSAGAAGVQEIFVTQISTGNLLWALVDGDAQDEINIQIGALVFDLLA